jgi:hypothetical protein
MQLTMNLTPLAHPAVGQKVFLALLDQLAVGFFMLEQVFKEIP